MESFIIYRCMMVVVGPFTGKRRRAHEQEEDKERTNE